VRPPAPSPAAMLVDLPGLRGATTQDFYRPGGGLATTGKGRVSAGASFGGREARPSLSSATLKGRVLARIGGRGRTYLDEAVPGTPLGAGFGR
ncbi:hypothetical protein THAOC_08635, partial [Thalassiosira oceanica]